MRRLLIAAFTCCFALRSFAGNWTELGPKFAGRVSGIVATDVNHVWVSTPGGGVWKSTDGGANFTWPGNIGFGDFTAVHLALDRNNPARMYLRVWSGLLVSTDGAAHWTQPLYSQQGDTAFPYPSSLCGSWPACPPIGEEWGEPGPFAQMVFTPAQSIVLTALPCQGIQYSIDSGAHFSQHWPFSGSPQQRIPDNCISAIAADETTHQVWIATMDSSGPASHIYRSHQAWTAGGPPAGLTWDLVNTGITSPHPAISLAWGGSANRVMALVNIGSSYSPFLFNGTSWTPKPFGSPATCVFGDAREVVWGGGDDFFAGGVTFAATNNAGSTWNCPPLGMQYVDIRAVYPNAALHSVWIGGDQNQFGNYHLLTRYTWNPGSPVSAPAGLTASGITSWQTYSIGQGYNTNRLLVGAQDIGTACSANLGSDFSLTPTEETQAVVWPQSGGANTVYLYGTKGTLQKATNATTAASCNAISWSTVTPPDSFLGGQALDGPHTLTVRPNDPTKVFLIRGGIVVYSTNGGGAWAASTVPITVSGGRPVGLTSIMADEDGVLYVGTQDHGVYSCADTTHFCDGSAGAGAWTPFALNPGGPVTPPAFVLAIAQSNAPPAPRNFWLATSQGVYRRLAGSTTWTPVLAPPLYPVSDVVIDPTCKTRIYAAFGWLANVTRTRAGIQASTDNGVHWTSLTSGFPLHNVPITQVVVDAVHPERLFTSTYGRGTWRYDWTTPMPACAP